MKRKKKCSSAWGLRRKRRTGPWQFVSLWLMVPDFSFHVKSSSDVQCHLVLWLPTPPSPKCRAGLVRFPSSDNFSDYLFWYFNLDNSVHFLCVALAGVTVSVYTSLPSFLFFFLLSSLPSGTLGWFSKEAKNCPVIEGATSTTPLFQH